MEPAATTSARPLAAIGAGPLSVEGGEHEIDEPWAGVQTIDRAYFATAGIPLAAGRAFEEREARGDEPVAIVNETFARRYFPGQDPLGRRIKLGVPGGTAPWLRIVGVVGDVKHAGLDWDYLPEVFVPHGAVSDPLFGFLHADIFAVLRTDGVPPTEAVLRNVIATLDPDLPLLELMSGEQIVQSSAQRARLQAAVMSAVALLAVLLSAVGLYGVVAQAVAQRRRELGIRAALAILLRALAPLGRRYTAPDSGNERGPGMSGSRRDFLRLAAALGIATGAAATALGQREPTAGLIFPPLDYPIPPDAKRLFPSGIRFIGNGVGLPGGMTIEGYEEAIPRVVPRAQDLAREGADLISVFGSSLTFYRGAAFNQELTERVTKATGLPATTQSNGLLDGLKHVNARRVALATAYTDEVTERLKIFLEEHGFIVTAAQGLGFVRIPEGAATEPILHELGTTAYARSNKADALVMSCGALHTLDVIVPLEAAIGAPVVSSTPHGLWHCARMLGVDARIEGFGMVMAA
ncbi:MAG TPA: ABC transporter permease [Gammaproteobacteria bacterium]